MYLDFNMHLLPAFLLATALHLSLAAAFPSSHPHDASIFVPSIGLSRRSQLVSSQGVVNPSALKAHVVHIINKIKRGKAALENNIAARVPNNITSNDGPIIARGTAAPTVPLTTMDDELWFGNIMVGTPPTQYRGMFFPTLRSSPTHSLCVRSCLRHGIIRPDTPLIRLCHQLWRAYPIFIQ